MKKYALFAAAALVALAACSKNEVKPQTPETPVDDDSPVAVQFGVNAPVASVSTKATGSVGDVAGENNVWNGQPLYILGFDRNITDFTNAASTNPEQAGRAFIWNVKATAPAPDPSSEPPVAATASGIIDVWNPDPDGDPDTPAPAEGSEEPFYYQGNTVYDFYGYHVDDAWATVTSGTYTPSDEPVTPTVEANRIYVPFVIDGGQDLMIAKADPAYDIEGTEVQNPANAYSAYAARRGVQPTLTFKHQLARFTFEVVAGSESANTIQVDSIKLRSRTTGNLVVVGTEDVILGIADTTATDPTAWMELRQRNATGSLEGLQPVELNDYSEDPATEPQRIGESILAMPGVAEYELRVVLKDTREGVTTPIEPQVYDLTADSLTGAGADATKFEAGKSYKVTIKVYGLEKVEITAALQAWEDGGSTTIDPDDPPTGNDDAPEPEPEPGA